MKNVTEKNYGGKILNMALIALMTAFLCVVSPFSIQLPGQVPISLSFMMIYLCVYLLGGIRGTICCVLYLLIGLMGLPVFSSFGSGVGKLAGPTGGYLVGYIFLAAVCGAALYIGKGRLWVYIAGMVLGSAAAYFFGTMWFMYSMQTGLKYTLSVCVFPFIPFDLAKIAAAAILGPLLKRLLCRIDGVGGVIAYMKPQKPKSA
ncbi:MAG: biotin transporter BioY [Butyrivibrio sp.]|nr:biotin transporter BioY [Butyrivibrio sp.]